MRRNWAIFGLLLLVVLVTFGRTLLISGWVSDDTYLINRNPAVFCGLDVSLRQLAQAWWYPYEGMYLPAVYNFWWLVSLPTRLFDGTMYPLQFHLANLLLHSVNGLLVYAICRRFIAAVPALAAALIFVVHPMQTEVVSWASSMKDLLSGSFFFGSVLLYLRVDEVSDKKANYTLSLILACFATMAKPSTIVIAPCLLILEWLRGTATTRKALLRALPFALVAIPAALIQTNLQPSTELWRAPLVLKPWIASYSMVHYFWKTVVPTGFTPDYGVLPLWIVVSGAGIAATLVLAALLAGILLLPREHRKMVVCALLFMAAALAPVLGFTVFSFQLTSTVADRYFYLSMLGAALLIGYAVQVMPRLRYAVVPAVVVLAAISFVQTSHWQSNDTLYARSLELNPDTFTYVDHTRTDEERYALAARLLLQYPTSQYGCQLMRTVCLNRGDTYGALIYEQRLVDRAIMYNVEPKELSSQCAYFVQRLVASGWHDRARHYAEIANRLGPTNPEVRRMNEALKSADKQASHDAVSAASSATE